MTRINGEPVGTPLPESLWHGFFVFTTLRLEGGEPLWLPEHLERLRRHAQALGIAFPGFKALEREVEHHCQQRADMLLRLVVAPEAYVSSARPFAPPPEATYTRGVSVCVTSLRVHPDLGHYKTGNYLPYRLARLEAERAGHFEGLLLDAKGHVVDGSRTSPLLYRAGELCVLQGGVEGITRQKVAEQAATLGLRVSEARLKPDELEGQLLLAGTGVGLLSVGKPLDSALEALITHFRPSGPLPSV
ncbi:aminotransferase class IV [Calidithermus timidus]|jgi:4-amino-4-deoxychorismate lyase|uniref:aminotransferase class IV n=1 Tax=Calidithermus timidus TaxID=307124 RepID=UPI00037692CE|nr:aminotransferase class IV [Calidithermus timidus]